MKNRSIISDRGIRKQKKVSKKPHILYQLFLGFIFFSLLGLLFFSIILKKREDISQKDIKQELDAELGQEVYILNQKKYLVNTKYLVVGCDPFPKEGEDRLIPSLTNDPNLDCIASIDEPKFTKIGNIPQEIDDNELVIGVSYKGYQKAYPIKTIFKHEVINDWIAGDPVLVTYCPLNGAAVLFKRVVNNIPVEFGVSGRLYSDDLVMYDRATASLWLQLTGEAIAGQLISKKLEPILSEVVPFGTWREIYPDTIVLRVSGEIKGPAKKFDKIFSSYEKTNKIPYPYAPVSDEFKLKSWFRGISFGSKQKAYPELSIKKESVVNDMVGEEPIVIFNDSNKKRTRFFKRQVRSKVLSFYSSPEGIIKDKETNSSWNFEGIAFSGSLADAKLIPVIDYRLYWFSWKSIYPDTEIYYDVLSK